MSWLYRRLARPILFTRDPEWIHEQTMHSLSIVSRNTLLCEAVNTFCSAPELPVEAFGLRFPNPIGLAAGMDKEAIAVRAWEAMGFGFSELGAVTWHPQPGNPAPRVFRAIPEQAIVNRMGFNNPGAEIVADRIRKTREAGHWPKHPVGMNLGKSKITPLTEAADDYAKSFEVLWPYLDFFVVNVSSPNTPNLRMLQDKAALQDIFKALQEKQGRLLARSGAGAKPKPILVKVAPDLTWEALDEILQLVQELNVAGIVATNTTITRPSSTEESVQRVYSETGGLSGKPLRNRSTEVIRYLHTQSKGAVPIIGVGGIFNAADAFEKLQAGATLLQVYTGLVYEGPQLVREIVRGLRDLQAIV